METIAITSWKNIISPLYDASCYFLIVKSDGSRKITDVRNMSLFDKANFCADTGVNVMICGAISNIADAILHGKNIKVISWICGPIEEVIEAYLNNVNLTEMYSMPDCDQNTCRKKHRRRYQRGNCKKH